MGVGGRGAKVLHSDIHTDPLTKWVLEELSRLKNRTIATLNIHRLIQDLILVCRRNSYDWKYAFFFGGGGELHILKK